MVGNLIKINRYKMTKEILFQIRQIAGPCIRGKILAIFVK